MSHELGQSAGSSVQPDSQLESNQANYWGNIVGSGILSRIQSEVARNLLVIDGDYADSFIGLTPREVALRLENLDYYHLKSQTTEDRRIGMFVGPFIARCTHVSVEFSDSVTSLELRIGSKTIMESLKGQDQNTTSELPGFSKDEVGLLVDHALHVKSLGPQEGPEVYSD